MENIAGRIELFHNLYLVCLIGTVVFLVISIIVFWKLNIKDVIGFFTGKQAKKEISKIEESDFGRRVGIKNITSSMKTEKISHGIDTSKIKKGEKLPVTAVTTKLEEEDMGATTLLNVYDEGATTLLNVCDEGATTLLQPENVAFYLEYEIVLIHTKEIIE